MGNWTDAEDATQETFLKAHQHAGGFAGRCAPSTWLFSIARHTCLDRLRADRSRSFTSLEEIIRRANDPPANPDSAHHRTSDAAAETEWRWYLEAVREGCLLGTLACLSFDQRVAFVLRVLCEMSTEDTAEVLERSANAVRVLTHRARHSLKTFLCRNCSIYDPANRCRCQNLVGFSLSKGWLGPDLIEVTPVVTAAEARQLLLDDRSAGAPR